MLVSIQLDEEEKFQVLLVAFGLFALALLTSACLAFAFCPLNRWLLERNEKAKRRRQEAALRAHRNFLQSHQTTSQQSYYANYCNNQQQSNKSATLNSYLGPPPAYEAALRAHRLQSLTGGAQAQQTTKSAAAPKDKDADVDDDAPDWLRTVLTNQSDQSAAAAAERKLDLGDYFHSPRETSDFYLPPTPTNRRPDHFAINFAERSGAAPQRPQPPVMLRLWVKLLEPGELVQRAREQAASETTTTTTTRGRSAAPGSGAQRMSLTRQLSIPQLFGSLMTLAGSGAKQAICDKSQTGESNEQETAAAAANQENLKTSEAGQLSSLTSTGTSASSSSSTSADDQLQRQSNREKALDSATTTETSPGGDQSKRAEDGEKSRPRPHHSRRRRSHSMPAVSSITSRVLHMNVASFSYVKDENLISTKKHNQLNFHHFYASTSGAGAAASAQTSHSLKKSESVASSKMCQLLVSICDIENLLNSRPLEQRACLRLAQNSSVYVKCEILAPKSTGARAAATRLLRNPLKVLTHQPESSGSLGDANSHTINFASTIPAAAIEPTPSGPINAHSAGQQSYASLEAVAPAHTQRGELPPARLESKSGNRQVKWRHEPAADGKSIVMFNSIPKQIAQQQQLAFCVGGASSSHLGTTASNSLASSFATGHSFESSLALGGNNNSNTTTTTTTSYDLIQFDSVFVSPILAKSLLEEGHLRLRVYAQCKYVNESCLAELKLPLRQLMRAQTRDNLGDAVGASATPSSSSSPDGATGVPQQQADFILNSLLANLVTASTGSPLSTLIEQISAEERDDHDDHDHDRAEEYHSRWPENTLQRASNSLGAALNSLGACEPSRKRRLMMQAETLEWDDEMAAVAAEHDLWQNDCDKLIEQNYCRSLMVSHWLNYLVAPSYECQLREEPRGQLVLGLTYLPTSNRLIFNAHRATLNLDAACQPADSRQLVKRLRLEADTSYLVRFMMVVNNRIIKRKQTSPGRRPEWDSQEPVTFDLVSVQVDQPSFIVALVMRNPHSLASHATGGGSLQSLTSYHHQVQGHGGGGPNAPQESAAATSKQQYNNQCQSDPESLRLGGRASAGSGIYRPSADSKTAYGSGAKRDLVIGHFVLAQELWHELKTQPRRQLIKQFKLL